jgi:hypothetical protein
MQFYGVFSAGVLWHKEKPHRKDAFDWKSAAWTLHVPMIKALFEQVATPTKLGPLGLVEVLDWTAVALNRVIREEFFARFVEDHAVQYFYEPFLEAFDPELRKQLGVWYLSVPLDDSQNERAGIFLTNALTGWDENIANPRLANWPELEAERKGAGKVKQDKPILVILGNLDERIPFDNATALALPSTIARLGAYLAQGQRFDWSAKTKERPHNPAQI